MSDSIIAVVPDHSKLDSIQASLSTEGVHVQFIRSLEEALKLLVEGHTPVYVCDSERGNWRESIARLLRTRQASRVVLLSRMADERV